MTNTTILPSTMSRLVAGCVACALALTANVVLSAEDAASQGKPDHPKDAVSVRQLQEDFLKLKFGMFVCFDMATYVGKEWVDGYPDPSTFNPGGTVDTDAWADAAKAAGMKYAVLTTKHVSGFCLWDSKHTSYDIMHPACPYKQDVVGQFVKSFTSRGLKVGLYYCWRNPGFDDGPNSVNKGKYKVLPLECDPATHSLEEQIAFQKKQIRELVEKYPDTFYIWNDTLDPNIMPAEDARAFTRSLGPNIIACGNWWDWAKKGTPYLDLVVSETKQIRELADDSMYLPGETCWLLEGRWFYNGSRPKRAEIVMQDLIAANSRRMNFLLNVSPDKKGKMGEASVKTLAEVGAMWKPINEIPSSKD
jgi:alpha-L-fucosidase